jgi:hypothetical protein
MYRDRVGGVHRPTVPVTAAECPFVEERECPFCVSCYSGSVGPGEVSAPNEASDAAGHISPAAQRGLDLPVPVWAFGYLNYCTGIGGDGGIDEFGPARTAGGVDRHSA